MVMNVSIELVKKDLILGIKECQKFTIFFNHGDEYQFEIGKKTWFWGLKSVKNSKFSSTMVKN